MKNKPEDQAVLNSAPPASSLGPAHRTPYPSLQSLESTLGILGRVALSESSWRDALRAILELTQADEAELEVRQDSRIVASAHDVKCASRPTSEWSGPESGPVRLRLRGYSEVSWNECLCELLARQCVFSWQLLDRLARTDLQAKWSQFALDRLSLGVLLLDGSAKIYFANRSAKQVLAEPGELSVVNDRLVASTPVYSKRLSAILGRVLESKTPGKTDSAALLRVPYGANQEVLELLVASTSPALGVQGEIAVALLYLPKTGISTPTGVLRLLYGLTESESRVVQRLLRGRTVEQVSEDLGVAQDTIRQHLKSIFQKVGTTRQSDLIAALLTGPGELRWD